MNKENIMERTVIEKNSRESVVVSETEYKGNKYVDVRVFYKDTDGSLKPTRKGVSVRPEKVAELVAALSAFVDDSVPVVPSSVSVDDSVELVS
jgi:hypothetical protein|tara:strand:+ start:237 stop:515 length:279 start_codon:yes stop_codon:yes gene_type:complete